MMEIMYSEFSLIHHRFIHQTFYPATISQCQYNVQVPTYIQLIH